MSGPAGAAFADAASASTGVTFGAPGDVPAAADGQRRRAHGHATTWRSSRNPGNEPPRVSAGLDGPVTTAVLTLAGQVSDDGLPVGGVVSSRGAW